jgi:hypothetical protein
MLRKNQRPFLFTEVQLQQLKRTEDSLRKLNRDALRALRRIGFTDLTNRKYSEAGQSLRIVATQIISALQFREEILIAGREQQPQTIEVRIGRRCATCFKNRRLREPADEESDSSKALKQDPGHQTEIDSLLELAYQTEGRVSERCKSGGAIPHAFIGGISRLRSALLRQSRHLRDIAPRQTTEIEVLSLPRDVCMYCHKRTKNDDEHDEANESYTPNASQRRENGVNHEGR